MFTIDEKIYRTAIIHDWFCNMGGGDKVAESLLKIMPDSPIFTLCYLSESLTEKLKKADIRTSFLQKKLNQNRDNHQKFLPFMPMAFESFDLNDYDVVISSSSCCAKGVITNPNTLHICYCHTPMRYAWELFYEYIADMSSFKKKLVNYLMNYMRIWDCISSSRVDFFVANSENVKKRIWKYYRRESVVINPPIDTDFFVPGEGDEEYYLCISRLVKYKRIDLAVHACNELSLPLIVIGQGAEMDYLKKIAGSTVKILGKQSDDIVKGYYQKCKALIFPGEEDFGMTPLEAQACGRPVIAFRKGGALETVIEDETGIFFDSQDRNSLIDAMIRFDKLSFSKENCRNNALRFSKDKFISSFTDYIIGKVRDKNNE